MNTRMCAAAFAAALAAAAETVVKVDFSREVGPVKPVNGVGQPPMVGKLSGYPMFRYLKDAGIPYSRLHDVSGWLGGGLFVDIPNLFPNFDADENDPGSYCFAYTDSLMKALDDNGVEPFFRLGVTIENFVGFKDRFPPKNILPPKDFAKWARICEHVIRHYTEGWADGFRMKVTYWEIWNEPENHPDDSLNPMFRGPFSEYMRLYGVVSTHLKKCFPHLKIGGYGHCGFYAGVGSDHIPAANSSPRKEYFVECSRRFLAAARDNKWPLDFFSYHSYSAPKEALRQVRFADEHLSEYGFTADKCERIFNEWLPYVKHENLGTALQAAGVAAELIGLQNGPCDVACIYDARCGVGNYSPLFNPLTYGPHKAYYAFTAFNELRRRGTAVAVRKTGDEDLWVAAAKGGEDAAVMMANDSDRAIPLACDFAGRRVLRCRITDERRTDEAIPFPCELPPRSFVVAILDNGASPSTCAAGLSWPEPSREMKPWAYNWWMGSAVDEEGIEAQCRELADKGFGGFHVIPIYGAKNGYERKWRKLLSPEWAEAWNMSARAAERHGLGIDLTMGSGWCFGGPWVDREHAASSGMKVKRAGPGGAGYMIDPFDPEAMRLHVSQFEGLFGRNGTAMRPRAFYHDSYEYYGAAPKHGEDVDDAQLACFRVWTDWCRENGYLTRNEAHGSPCNWLDFYALADIPETEMFGRGCRDILISKFASSAAHAKGTTLVSAESCTWIDEHFCERPAEIKEFIDLLFLAGVNHVFYHGCCYSPVDAVWPGWCFYASLEMNPRNPIWREMGALNAYVTRCQSLFQTWTPDNDLAIVWDPSSYRAKHPGETAPMNVHKTEWFYDEPIGKVAKGLYEAGYAFDYVSPRMVKAGLARKYAALVDPAEYLNAGARRRGELLKGVRKTPFCAASGLLATRWRKGGETAYFAVNTGTVARVVSSKCEFTSADALSGAIAKTRSEQIAPGHSRFLVGEAFEVGASGEPGDARTAEIAGPWRVSAVCGGPEPPAPRTLGALVGWETFAEFFSGTMLYKTTFDLPCAGAHARMRSLSLGDVREIARVRLNGSDVGVRFIPPYDYEIPEGVLKDKGNELEVEVTNLGANRLRWNDVNKVDWKYFSDINMVDLNYKALDASKWEPRPSGLLGPVRLLGRSGR